MNDVLTVRDAHKRFGDTQALRGVDFTLHRGEWLALLGPNGAGKTTLVRAVAGRVRLDKGTMALLDVSLDGEEAAQARRRLGVVPQEIALYPLLTARENLRAFGTLNGVPGKALDERIGWALAWAGLEERAREPIKRFSGGMKRRLNLACGVLHEPEVILLDEPTVGVDPQSRQRIWEMLGALRERGAALLLTTHQLDEAERTSDRIVIIDHGRAIASGSFPDLLRDTIGTRRRVTFVVDGGPSESLVALGFETADAGCVVCHVEDVVLELPRRLSEIAQAGATVTDIRLEAPTLQAVFIHLTGKELRE